MSGDAQLKSFIDRVLRLKEEQDTLANDIREVYAEAKAEGFDKTAMGQLVAHLRKKDKNPDKLAEQSALFDLYLEAYERPSHAHTREGEQAAATISNPPPSSSPAADLPEPSSPAEAKTGAEPPPSAPVEDFQPPAFLAKKHVLRPHCLEPHLCRSGTSDHCHHCKKAMAESEAA